MSNPHNNEAILEIIEEDSSLREEFYTILDSIMKNLASFNYPKASGKFTEYFNFKRMLKDFVNLPKNKREGEFERLNVPTPLTLEDREIAMLIRLLPLKLSTFEKKIRKEIELLEVSDDNFFIMMFLDHILYLLRNAEFRDLVLAKNFPMALNSEIKNSE